MIDDRDPVRYRYRPRPRTPPPGAPHRPLSEERDPHGDVRPLAFGRLDVEGAAHGLDDLARDGQAEAEAAKSLRPRRVALIEIVGLRDLFGDRMRHSHARVHHGYLEVLAVHLGRDVHVATVPVELAGVLEQVDKNLLHALHVHKDREGRSETVGGQEVLRFDVLHARLQGALDEDAHVDRPQVETDVPLRDGRKVENVAERRREELTRVLDDADERAELLVGGQRARLVAKPQQLRGTQDAIERRDDLVTA